MELQMDPNVSYALALEGGGARGGYQIGAWQAFREAGVRIDAVAGTSVGALNGALIAQGEPEKAAELWSNIHHAQVVDNDLDLFRRLFRGGLRGRELTDAVAELAEVLRRGGLDATPLQETIRRHISEEAVKASPTELYIVTYSLSEQKTLELRAKDLGEGELWDMLMASAYLPVFRNEKLGGKRYADGGVRDVLPLHVLIENGYKNIIAVRLYAFGIERPVRIPRGTELTTLVPSGELGGTLDMDAEQSRENLRRGYFDAMRLLYALKGKKYYLDLQWDEDTARAYLAAAALRLGREDGWTDRSVHEKLLPALAKWLDQEKGSYADVLCAALEWAAEAKGLDLWAARTEDEMLSELGDGALDALIAGVLDDQRPPRPAAPAVKREEKLPDPTGQLNVCLLNDSFPPVVDGVANAVLNYARCLTDAGDRCVVGTPDYPGVADDYPFDVVRYPSLDTSKMVGYRAGYPFDLAVVNSLAEYAPDIIHTHCPVSSTILARVLRERVQRPVVFTYHTKFDIDIENAVRSPLVQEAAVKLLVNNIAACDEVWTVSRGAGENLRSLGYEGDYIVMPNGVDLPRGRATEEAVRALREKWDLPGDVPTFLFLGRIMWYKGLRLILDALKLVRDSGRDFRMVFVGDGMDRAEVETHARELGLWELCRFTGAERDRETIRAWYTLADLFLFPSTFDTNGLVVREAAACSLGSLLIRGSCAADDITDGDTGILVPETAEGIAAALLSPDATKEKFRRIGENASEKIYLSWTDSVERARAQYRSVIERWNSGELRRKRTRFDGFFDLTGDVSETLDRARAAMEKYF